MPKIEIRELKAWAAEILRRVRERKTASADASAWHELERLGKAIGKDWRSPKTGPDLLSESRR
jgi:hypothetical protein